MHVYGGVALGLLIGIVVGVVAITAVSAQGPPGAYAIIDVAEITDPAAYSAVVASAPAGLVPFGGRYIVRSEKVAAVAGQAQSATS
jgi:predicted ATPase